MTKAKPLGGGRLWLAAWAGGFVFPLGFKGNRFHYWKYFHFYSVGWLVLEGRSLLLWVLAQMMGARMVVLVGASMSG